MGIPRTLFYISDAFANFRVADPYYDDGYFFEGNESTVKMVDEPGTYSDEDDENAALIKGTKSPITPKFPYLDEVSKLIRRRNGTVVDRSSNNSSIIHVHGATTVPSNRGKLHQLMNFIFPEVVEVDEPNDHTFYDHYKMSCHELDDEDAIEPLHDELMLRKAWLLLELMPMKRMWQERGKWRSTFM